MSEAKKTLEQLQQDLDSPIPRSAVKEREGNGGRSFSYLSADYVIARMNQLFGNLNWSTETVEVRAVHTGTVQKYGKDVHTCHYIARVKVEVQHLDQNGRVLRTSHMGTGYGDGSDKENMGKAHELAAKEAESDALKRACKNLGQSMGLALYDKDQTNVIEDSAPASSSRPENKPAGKPAQASTPGTSAAPAASSRPAATSDLHASRGQGAPTGREQLNKRILSLARIKASKTGKTLDDIRGEMKQAYGVDKSDALTDTQAAEFAAALEKAVS